MLQRVEEVLATLWRCVTACRGSVSYTVGGVLQRVEGVLATLWRCVTACRGGVSYTVEVCYSV